MSPAALGLRLVPVIVACPLLLQNLDTTVMTTALPAMAASLGVPALDLNLAIASYVLSLAIFLPASAWLAERFGPRRVFCAAIAVFSLGSALCGLAGSLPELVAWRLLQGAGGAMMVPVGRTILLRSVPPERMMTAMVWFTVPGAIGRLMGPAVGGALVTVASWRWIFLVNIPFGVLGVLLALGFIEADGPSRADAAPPPDLPGLGLLAAGLAGLLGGLEMVGKGLLPPAGIAAMLAAGAVCTGLYLRHARRVAEPILDLSVLRRRVFRISVLGAMPFRVAIIGALPFLMPLLFQLGFGMTPMASGLLSMGSALGGLATRGAVARAVQAWGFRRLLVASTLMAAMLCLGYALFDATTSAWLIFGVLFVAGLCNSMTMVALNTVGYADIPKAQAGHATAMATMAHQLAIALGVVAGAAAVSLSGHLRHGAAAGPQAGDFAPVFAGLAALAACSAWAFGRLRPQDGDALRGQRPG